MTDTTPASNDGKLFLEIETPERVRVDFEPAGIAWKHAHPHHEGVLPRRPLVHFDTSTKTIHTYPLRTTPSLSIMAPKYAPVVEIAFESFEFALPEAEHEVEEQLYGLADHFYFQPMYGLGIRLPFRPIIEVIGRNGFHRLVISRTRGTALDHSTFVLAKEDFDGLAYELNRIAARFSDQSRAERSHHVYNELLAGRFPEKFTRDLRSYRKGVLVSFLRQARATKSSISTVDREALLTHAGQEAPALARRNPHQLYKLQRDFEIAGINELITRFEADLLNSRPEPFWQKLLKLNPFILSMLFGYPIVLVHSQAHVGGQRLGGSGGTIVDFLLKNASTDSLAIVEIKKPDTPLMGREFRPGRYRPSAEINEAVIQVMDQRYELLVNYKSRAKEAGTAHAVDCLVVAGRTPTNAERLASFEMYRTSLRDVRIYTFDEVFLKLCALRDYLAPPSEPVLGGQGSDLPF